MMKIVRIYSLTNHVAMSASAERAQSRGDKIIAMCRSEQASLELKAVKGIVFIDPTQKGYFKKLKKECLGYDYIFLHSLAEDYTFAMRMLMNPSLLRRAVWIVAGGDLYSWSQPVQGGILKRIGAVLRNVIAKRYRQKIPYVICQSIDAYKYNTDFGDAVLYSKEANNPGYSFQEIEKFRPSLSSSPKVRIMIGHSSTKELSHEEVIKKLIECKLPEDTEYVFPLNYGNKEYGDQIASKAIESFGDKAHIFRDKLPFPEYVKLLWSVDCAIFHTKRQIALGNILMLLYMKKKIFLDKGSVLWKYLTDRGVQVFDIASLSREQLLNNSFDLDSGKRLAQEVNNEDRLEIEWNNILNDLKIRAEGDIK